MLLKDIAIIASPTEMSLQIACSTDKLNSEQHNQGTNSLGVKRSLSKHEYVPMPLSERC